MRRTQLKKRNKVEYKSVEFDLWEQRRKWPRRLGVKIQMRGCDGRRELQLNVMAFTFCMLNLMKPTLISDAFSCNEQHQMKATLFVSQCSDSISTSTSVYRNED